MQGSFRLALGFVAVTILAKDTLACSDIKTFLAPCNVKESGQNIPKERALDVPAEFVNIDALRAIADKAVAYFDFDLAVFNGKCEVPISEACNIINCGCDEFETFDGSVPPKQVIASDKCYPFPNYPGCQNPGTANIQDAECETNDGACNYTVANSLSAMRAPWLDAGETIMALCFGNRCKGFSFFSEKVNENRRSRCGESIDVCNDDPQEPLCDAEIVTKCCDTPSLVCVCETCSLRVWRQTETGSGQPAFIHRQSGNRCTCTNNRG